MLGTDRAKGLIICRTNTPERGLLGAVGFQSLTKDDQGVVALCKGMTQIGTGTRTIIAIMHFTITEMNHEVVLVDHLETEDLGGCCRNSCHQESTHDDGLEKLLDHIVLKLLVSVVVNYVWQRYGYFARKPNILPTFSSIAQQIGGKTRYNI